MSRHRENLSGRQADGPGQRQLALLERVLRDDEPRPRRLQLHLLAHDVDAGDDAGGALIVGKPHQGFGGSDLCLRRFHPRGVSLDLKVERADRKDDGFAHIAHVGLTGAHERVAGTQAADGARVEERRRHADTRASNKPKGPMTVGRPGSVKPNAAVLRV